MARASLKIAGREISIISWLDFDQKIDPIGGASVRRLASGSAFKLTHWQKYRVSISCGGWIPAPLLGIDYSQPFEIELPLPVSLLPGETLPAGWSSRDAPWGEREVVDQANQSVRLLFVRMAVVAEPPRQSHNQSSAPAWDMTFEQV